MSELAKDFGMSDVGLAKRCRAVDVPILYRGYWARKAAGQEPPKTPLPKYRPHTPAPAGDKPLLGKVLKPIVWDREDPQVRFGIPPRNPDTGTQPEPEIAEDVTWRAERDAFEREPANAIIVEL